MDDGIAKTTAQQTATPKVSEAQLRVLFALAQRDRFLVVERLGGSYRCQIRGLGGRTIRWVTVLALLGKRLIEPLDDELPRPWGRQEYRLSSVGRRMLRLTDRKLE
jgi:hypothetical protein